MRSASIVFKITLVLPEDGGPETIKRFIVLQLYHTELEQAVTSVTERPFKNMQASALSHRQNYTSLYSFDCEFRIQTKLTTG